MAAPPATRLFLCAAASLLLVHVVVLVNSQSDPAGMVAYDEKFILGVKNYAMKKWSAAIIHLGQAMEEYEALEAARLECFSKCHREGNRDSDRRPDMAQSQLFFYQVIQRKHCIRQCEEDAVGLLPSGGISSHVLQQLKRKDGYNYLQVSYYNEGKLKEAARACSTFKYHNPLNQQILKDLTVYRNTKGVDPEDMEPITTLPYRESYAEGHRLFYTDNWSEMVQVFEGSLLEFYKALDECRTLCDGPIKFQENLEFSQVVGKLAMQVQDCRVKCVRHMGEFRSDKIEDFFGSYFHYLQRGYHKLNQSLQALQAVAAQVRLEPHTKMPQRNSVFYLRQPGVTRKDFAPREDVVKEVVKRENDLKFLSMLKEFLGKDHTKEDKKDAEAGSLDQTLLDEDFRNHPPVGVAVPSPGDSLLDGSSVHLPETVQVVQTPDDFNGLERAVFDQVLTDNECQDLIHLASYGHEGDGYQQKSPHTFKEKFEGLHILEAAERASSGELDRRLTWLYLNYSHVAKELVAREFSLQQPLYFSYTHLVCRTALEGVQGDRNDLSHPVHSDNCILDEAHGVCRKEAPAYTWRDYSAILYLNGDFEGGDFFFAKSLKDLTPDVRVKPRCGRLVGFSAGQENLHGVTAVTKGKRCAIALWFTLDHDHKEHTFDVAETLLATTSS